MNIVEIDTQIKYKNNKQKKKTKNKKNNILDLDLINFYLNKNIPNKKPHEKIYGENFHIPKYNQFSNILTFNYNVNQLKEICKFYLLKHNGNKVDLKKKIYNYLFYTHNSIIIQKFIRKCFVKIYIKLHGPGFFNRKLCTNDVDFCSLDEMKIIPYYQFFSFKDDDGFVYGYDILSLYNLYKKNNQDILNPFNQKKISKTIVNEMLMYIKLSKMLKTPININYDNENNIDEIKKLDFDVLSLFQSIDALGFYTNIIWFNKLNKIQLINFFKELYDIWNYRANLNLNVKRDICPPLGNPFYISNINININFLYRYNFLQLKRYIISIIDNLVNKGINNSSKSLGAYYVLASLTLVNNDAAEALPWLYEAVIYN